MRKEKKLNPVKKLAKKTALRTAYQAQAHAKQAGQEIRGGASGEGPSDNYAQQKVEDKAKEAAEDAAGRVQAYSDKLYARLQELLGDRSIDEGRLVTEAAIFADKTAIDEETVRLHSHVAQYREILELDEPIGRKLDFLTQELNRESNTIGSKCQDVAITRLVVELKSEIEKIREQIQNIE